MDEKLKTAIFALQWVSRFSKTLCKIIVASLTRDEALPIKLETGYKLLDSVIQGGWYQAQIVRMAKGLEPDPKFTRTRASLAYLFPNNNPTPISSASLTAQAQAATAI